MAITDHVICPACHEQVTYEVPRSDRHREALCRCGMMLQWDEPPADNSRAGDPQRCQHPDRRIPGAVVPNR